MAHIAGDGGDDTLVGTSQDDGIFGRGGADRLIGLAGADVIDGGAGGDVLQGGAGSDTLQGGAGNDIIIGGADRDVMRGGGGADVFRFGEHDAGDVTSGPLSDVIYDFSSDDTLDLSGVNATYDRFGDSEPELGKISIWSAAGSSYVTWHTADGFHDIEVAGYFGFLLSQGLDQIIWHDDFPGGMGTGPTLTEGKTLHGSLEGPPDDDWFRVNLSAGRLYTFDVGDLLEPVVKLTDGNGNLVAERTGIDYGLKMYYLADKTGTYFLDVDREYWPYTGDFDLNLSSRAYHDDYGGGVHTQGSIAPNHTVRGEIGYPGDEDWFRLDVEAGKTYRIELRGESSGSGTLPDPFLRLLDAQGHLIEQNDNNAQGYDSRIWISGLDTGIYFIAASQTDVEFGDPGTYKLNVLSRDTQTPSAEAAAPHLSADAQVDAAMASLADKAGPITGSEHGDTLTGTNAGERLLGLGGWDQISGRGGNDTLEGGSGNDTLAGGSGDDRVVGGAGNDHLSGGMGRDILIGGPGGDLMSGGAGSDVFRFNDQDAGTGSQRDVISDFGAGDVLDIRQVDVLFQDYGFRSPARGGFAYGDESDGTIVSWNTFGAIHTVKLAGFHGDPDIIWYYDDYRGEFGTTEASLAVGQTVSGTLEVPEDEDWFSIQLQPGKSYRFDLRGAASGVGTLEDPSVSLWGADGSWYGTGSRDDRDWPLYVTTGSKGGTYYLRVDNDGAGNYNLGTGTYRLSATLIEDDFGNDKGSSGTVAVGQSLGGEIGNAGDVDWLRVHLTKGETYTIDLRGLSSGSGTLTDPVLALYDSKGHTLASDDDGGVGSDARLVHTATADATYYIEAAAYFDADCGTYQLSVSGSEHLLLA